METTIYKNDIQRRKLTEQLHIFELFNTVGIEMFTALVNSKNNENTELKFIDELNNRINEYNNLRIYCNEEFSKMSVTYNQVAPIITDVWELTTQKTQITSVNKTKK